MQCLHSHAFLFRFPLMQKINLKTISDILGAAPAKNNAEISHISTDSRTIIPGSLFIAIAGDNFDGHDFAADAVNVKGAIAVVVQRKIPGLPETNQIVVPDTRRAYLLIGGYIRRLCGARVIALTGSAGKTTVKEQLRIILSQFGRTHATESNFNNRIGVAKTLCDIPDDADFAVIEVGMSHAGEIAEMIPYIAPDVAIITNVYPMHLENFADISGIARAKAEIFQGLRPNGIAIINADSNGADILLAAAEKHADRVITYSRKDSTMTESDEHKSSNALCVLNTVNALGLDTSRVAEQLQEFDALPGRGKMHTLDLSDGGTYVLIDESYSAQPESLKIAIMNLNRMKTAGRKIAVIGEMAEIGEKSIEFHNAIGDVLAGTDIGVIVGIRPKTMDIMSRLPDEKFEKYYFENNHGLEKFLTDKLLRNGDTVLIKGSHYGARLFETVEKLLA